MNMFEEARSLDGMVRLCHLSQSELARRMGVSQAYVANKLRLLQFSERLQQRILEAGISERHARALLRLPDDRAREEALSRIRQGHLSVAMAEIMIDNLRDGMLAGRRQTEMELTEQEHERIRRAEGIIRDTVTRLRRTGIRATLDSEESDGRLYLNIAIQGVHPV